MPGSISTCGWTFNPGTLKAMARRTDSNGFAATPDAWCATARICQAGQSGYRSRVEGEVRQGAEMAYDQARMHGRHRRSREHKQAN